MTTFGSKHMTASEHDAFSQVCLRIHERFHYPEVVKAWLARMPSRTAASIARTREAIEGINKHREKLERI